MQEQRASWQYDILMACIRSDAVQALPIQEKREAIIAGIKQSLEWYRRTRQHKLLWWTIELCSLVERSTTVNEVRQQLRLQMETPASNTGVHSPAHQALEDYIGGYKRG